jgi:ABC-type nitrate/sulfonate/bicarbonate transport system ATPase subunit
VTAAVTIRNLTKLFQTSSGEQLRVLDDISFDVEKNEFICILGPSGCGKSTILNVLSGLETATSGEARIQLRQGERHPSVGYIFQEPRLLPWMTVRDNIRFVLKRLNLSEKDIVGRTDEALGEVGLTDFAEAYTYQLSGGMQARVSIARALATDPDLLLMDEPFSSLDELTGRSMRKLFLQLWEQRKKTILFVTHNMFEATFLADRIIMMSARPGRIYKIIENKLPRPRDYEDPAVFAASAAISKEFLRNVAHVE